jgi:hypothetical protein
LVCDWRFDLMTPILGVIASANQGQYISYTDYESIATVTVGSGGSASITFSSIPSTYQHLQIRCTTQENASGVAYDNLVARFNGDSSSNYSRHWVVGDGSAASAFGQASRTFAVCGFGVRNAAGASVFGPNVIDILDYADTNKNKTVRALAGTDWNGGGSVGLLSAGWFSTSAITSIVLSLDSSLNFTQYSSFALYGIKGN